MAGPTSILDKMEHLVKELDSAIKKEKTGVKKGNVKMEVKEVRDIGTILRELVSLYEQYERLTRL